MSGAARYRQKKNMGRRREHLKSALACLALFAAVPVCLGQTAADLEGLLRRQTQTAPVKVDPIPWRQVTAEELAMTAEPRAPGAPAIYLHTRVDQDNQYRIERIYQQIKVLSEEGRDRGNIQLAYRDPQDTIDGIAARVIQPDGTVVEFRDQVYDRPLAVNRTSGWRAKSFTLPDVRVGSVIEYQFYRLWKTTTFNSRWVLSQDLYTRHAVYAMQHPSWGRLQWSWPRDLPPGTDPPVLKNGVVRMETRDVPAFKVEPLMPPVNDMTVHVEFNWLAGDTSDDPAVFWREWGRGAWKSLEDFIGKPRDVANVLAGIVAPGDTARQKAEKIYEHARQIRNLQTEDPALRTDRDLETFNKVRNVRSLVRHGISATGQTQLYFIALARAAGLEAYPVEVASRKERFFDPMLKQTDGLDGRIVALHLDGREVFLDPAAGILPFGQLHWHDTGVPGLKLDKDGGQWITTPAPQPSDARVRRKATLELMADGTMEGRLEVRFSGHEATWRVKELRYLEEEIRRQILQEDVRRTIATEAQVTLVREPDWDARSGSIDLSFDIKLPEWALPAGDKMLVGVGLFGALERMLFIPPEREHPVYIEYPVIAEDQIEIALPTGFSVQSVPAAAPIRDAALTYSLDVALREGAVTIRRTLANNLLLVPAMHYQTIRSSFEKVRSSDEGQVVLGR